MVLEGHVVGNGFIRNSLRNVSVQVLAETENRKHMGHPGQAIHREGAAKPADGVDRYNPPSVCPDRQSGRVSVGMDSDRAMVGDNRLGAWRMA